MDEQRRREVALWRYGILGPLVSARLEHGDRRALFERAAERSYTTPTGRPTKLSARTIEDWYYRYLREGLQGLEPVTRNDAGRTKAIAPDLADLLVRAKKERPRRSIRRLIEIVVRAGKVAPDELSPATVHRLLCRAGVDTKRTRPKDRRAFLPMHAGDLWMGDVMHGPRVRAHDGKARKAYLISVMDVATRYLVGSEFRMAETAVEHEAVLHQALRVHGRPRTYYVDRGAAYWADSLRSICADLGIELVHTKPRDAEAKGAIERWHRTWRSEVGIELDEATPPSLEALNAIHWAWLATDYHDRVHATTGRRPRAHFLAEVAAGHHRRLAKGIDTATIFLHRKEATVRKDNTVSFFGRRLELCRPQPAGHKVELRYDPTEVSEGLPRAYCDGVFVCDLRSLDLHANARRDRRKTPEVAPEWVEPTGLDPLGDLQREYYGDGGDDA